MQIDIYNSPLTTLDFKNSIVNTLHNQVDAHISNKCTQKSYQMIIRRILVLNGFPQTHLVNENLRSNWFDKF